MSMALETIDRFWAKVNKEGPGGCWLWTAAVNGKGYGNFWVDGSQITPHRFSLRLHGQISGDSWALHHCDVKLCVNPDHLYAGTPTDNARDMKERGGPRRRKTKKPGTVRGERHGSSVLTEDKVREMRKLWAGKNCAVLGREYGVNKETARQACLGITWSHL